MPKDGKQYDRSAEDLGNIVGLEHVNLQVEDQGLTTLFYISGLGLTRDPYLMTSIDNMWVNVGRSQFHLTTGKPQHLRGRTGLVIPDREALLQRLDKMKKPLEGTRFAFKEHDDHVETTCPWGNQLLIHEPRRASAACSSACPMSSSTCRQARPRASPTSIARSSRRRRASTRRATCRRRASRSATAQELVFRETKSKLAAYDGHHIQVYVANFSRPHKRLLERKLITEESNQYQYRFDDITDLESGKPLFQIEHEVRSMTHPLYARPLVNRNPAQTNRNYVPGRDGWVAEPMDAGDGRSAHGHAPAAVRGGDAAAAGRGVEFRLRPHFVAPMGAQCHGFNRSDPDGAAKEISQRRARAAR